MLKVTSSWEGVEVEREEAFINGVNFKEKLGVVVTIELKEVVVVWGEEGE